MFKTRKRWVSLLVAIVTLAALLIPMVGPASAVATFGVVNVPSVTSPYYYNKTSNFLIDVDSATLNAMQNTSLYLSLPSSPSGFVLGLADMNGTQKIETDTTGTPSYVGNGTSAQNLANLETTGAQATLALFGPTINVSASITVTVYATSSPNMIELTFPSLAGYAVAWNGTTQAEITVPLSIDVPTGVTGPINVSAASSSSVFPSGNVAVIKVGKTAITVAAETAPNVGGSSTLASNLPGLIDLTEGNYGAFRNDNGDAFLKLTLPPGFSWNQGLGTFSPTYMWGDVSKTNLTPKDVVYNRIIEPYGTSDAYGGVHGWQVTNDGRELDFYNQGIGTDVDNGGSLIDGLWSGGTLSAKIFFKLQPYITIDESVAQTGDIVVTLGGATSSSVSTVTIGTYGVNGATVDAQAKPIIIAGKSEAPLGNLEIKESIPGSIIGPREIDLTLPSNVVWASDGLPQVDYNLSTNYGNLDTGLNAWSAVGSSGNQIKCEILANATSSNETNGADIILKNLKVVTSSDFTGDIAVAVSGSEGLTGTVNLATVDAPVSATASAAPDVQIGIPGQQAGDLTISEPESGVIGGDETYTALFTGTGGDNLAHYSASTTEAKIHVKTSATGVTFATTPTVTVTAGDLVLDSGSITTGTDSNGYGYLDIPIKSADTTASTIKITDISLTLDRSVPEGSIYLKVDGSAIDDTYYAIGSPNTFTSANGYATTFPNGGPVAKVAVANVTTPAPSETTGTAVFKIGDTGYTVNGAVYDIDVAPYIKDSRTFLPLRYIANAVGVADSNIIWDPTMQKVTISKGDRVVQLTIGSTTMLLNGASITMDTAPEINNGRTCLPVAWVAQALSAQIAWDATAQTVTITF